MDIKKSSYEKKTPQKTSALNNYMSGFCNDYETESIQGALPLGRNSPQRCNFGLYAEQLSGSAFTAPRAKNKRSWLYRIKPTIAHWGKFKKADIGKWQTAACQSYELPISPLRWDPLPIPKKKVSFIEAIHTISTCGDARLNTGMSANIYFATRSMEDEYFYNADGELLIIPEIGRLHICTELGLIDIEPGEIAIIPRGVKIRVEIIDSSSRGYLCENYGQPFTLPERGPIGANGLANARDFLTPIAFYEDKRQSSKMFIKWGGALWQCDLDQSPLDVVAWHGNYAPYKYDLRRFSPVGPILYDHADPSIFTVLTSPSDTAGTANIDFVIFPERWIVGENTFRPPWFHLNVMSEFMGLIYGVYDAKLSGGFTPGGMSLHNSMLPHGPDFESFEKARNADLKPQKIKDTLAFMLETRLPQFITEFSGKTSALQKDYGNYGKFLKKNFDSKRFKNHE